MSRDTITVVNWWHADVRVVTSLVTFSDAVSAKCPARYANWNSLKFPVDIPWCLVSRSNNFWNILDVVCGRSVVWWSISGFFNWEWLDLVSETTRTHYCRRDESFGWDKAVVQDHFTTNDWMNKPINTEILQIKIQDDFAVSTFVRSTAKVQFQCTLTLVWLVVI